MPRYRPVYDLTLHLWQLRDDSDSRTVAERVAAGELRTLAGLDNGGTPPLPGVVLAAQIAAEIALGWPENRIVWTSLGSESGTGNVSLGTLSLSATSTLFLGTLVGHSSGNLGALTFTGSSVLALGALAGVVISAGSASLGNLSLTGASTLSLGTLAGVQIGNTGNLALTGTSTLALGSLAGVTGAVNGDMGSLSLTGSSTLALGTLAGTIISNSFASDITPFVAGTSNAGSFTSTSGEGLVTTAGLANYIATIPSSNAAISIKVEAKFDSATDGDLRLCLLTNTGGYDWGTLSNILGYHALIYPTGAGTNSIRIRKGANTTLAQINHTFDTSYHTYKLAIAANGDISVLIDGVSVLTVNDASLVSGFVRAAIAAGAGTIHLKNLTVAQP